MYKSESGTCPRLKKWLFAHNGQNMIFMLRNIGFIRNQRKKYIGITYFQNHRVNSYHEKV